MELNIRKMVGKAHCYADNQFAEKLSKWYAVRKAYADGYKEAYNDIQKRAEEEGNHDAVSLSKHAICAWWLHNHEISENGSCGMCGSTRYKQTVL